MEFKFPASCPELKQTTRAIEPNELGMGWKFNTIPNMSNEDTLQIFRIFEGREVQKLN